MRLLILLLVASIGIACEEPTKPLGPASSGAPGTRLPASVSSPGQPWLALFEACRAGDYDKAYAQMASTYRSSVSVEAFKAAIRQNPLIAGHTDATTFSYGGGRGDGGSLHAEGAIATAMGAVRYEVFYVREQEQAKVLTLVVAGVPVVGLGVPAPAASASPSASASASASPSAP